MKSIFNYLLYFLLCFSLLNLHIDHSAKVRFSSATASECVDEEERCDITTQETNVGGLILTERRISMVTLIGVGVATVFIAFDCARNLGTCAKVGIIAAAIGAVALLAGEIAAIIMYKDVESKLEFREASVKEHDQDCDPDNDESGAGIGEISDDDGEVTNVCGQLSAINNQLTALKGSRTAAITSLALKSAALVAFGVATVAEIMAAFSLEVAFQAFKMSYNSLLFAQRGALSVAETLEKSLYNKQAPKAVNALNTCQAKLSPLRTKLQEAQRELRDVTPESAPGAKAEIINTMMSENNFMSPEVKNSCGNEILSTYPMFSSSFVRYKAAFAALKLQLGEFIDERPELGDYNVSDTGIMMADYSFLEKGITNLFQNFLFSKAFAIDEGDKKGVFSLVAFGGLVLAIVITTIAILKTRSAIAATPKTRAITYGVFAGAAGVAVGFNAAIIVELDKQIASLEAVLAESPTEAFGPNTSSEGGQGSSSSSAVDYGFDDSESDEIDLNPDDQPTVCPFGGDGKGGCKGESKKIKQELASLGFSTGSGSTASLLAKVSDALSDGSISSGDMDDVASLADKQAVIEKKLKKVLKKYNKLQKETGGKKFKLDKLTGIAAAKLKSKIVKSLRSNPKAMKGLQSGISSNLLASNSKKKDKKSILPSKRAVVGNTASSDNSGFNFQFDDEGESNSDFDLLDEEEYTEGMNIPVSGISNNEKGSIFSLITSRYMKSAYPVFFEEDE